ncbi:cathepsin B-like cysteine proteinase 6 [Zerene cesonia]|uniref:cathepsin B-like cysteine proteinase 6 n=1 Tax=Zerene cesonia TaxID=33412 RepID=UPI0018E50A2C|nr:cathepsin B-like cysteine proteinase 6 [Zerene cesonia]
MMYSTVVLLALASSALCFNSEVDEKFRTLPHDEFIKYFNSQNFSWKIQKNNALDDKVLDCVEVRNVSLPVKPYVNQAIGWYFPKDFDARTIWTYCFQERLKPLQKGCASCWAITVADLATSKKCIRTYYNDIAPRLSAMDLTCCKDCFSKSYCSGGSPERAALFWLKNGLVTESCKPYDDKVNETTCKQECIDENLFYNADKYFAERVYIMPADDHQIRYELVFGGPLIATFAVYEDLKDYKSGVYEHTHGKLIGHHALQVVGFGVENEVPYWIASTGGQWGDVREIKIKRFQDKLGFETQMISMIPRS